jgi:hypothetical protein
MGYRTDNKGQVLRYDAFKKNKGGFRPYYEEAIFSLIVDNGDTNDPISLQIGHHQYTEGREIYRENILTDEIHALNCVLAEQRKFKIIFIAQTNVYGSAATNLSGEVCPFLAEKIK